MALIGLNERWLQGNPPTYQEFADYWITETEQRKKEKPKPKDEWMFIRFMQKMKKLEPNARKGDLVYAWKTLQAQKAKEAYSVIRKNRKSSKIVGYGVPILTTLKLAISTPHNQPAQSYG